MSVKKSRLTPIEYDEISLVDSGASQVADVLIIKRASCDTPNSTGKKDGKSTRSKNWKEERHPRDEKGRMAESSSDSKSKYGKGGTTQSQLDAKCRDKKKKGGAKKPAKKSEKSTEPGFKKNSYYKGYKKGQRRRNRTRRDFEVPGGRPIVKNLTESEMSSWDMDARIRATLERKAT